ANGLKRIYREKLDLKNKSGGASMTWIYFEVPVIELRPKKAKPLQTLFEEIKVERHAKNQSDILKHKEKMSRLDRFTDCMESMAQKVFPRLRLYVITRISLKVLIGVFEVKLLLGRCELKFMKRKCVT
ncbi:hypothetical protein PV325_013992, partial [Microctonus aethiopoides]